MNRVTQLSLVALALAAAGCAGSKPSVKAPPAPVPAVPAAFVDVPMLRSSTSVDPTTMNVEIGAAARRAEDWVRDPGLVVLHLAKAVDTPRLRLYRQDNHYEAPDSSTVTVLMEALPDDSIAGIWTEYRLTRMDDGSWRVIAVRRAYKAYRGEDTETYGAEPTP